MFDRHQSVADVIVDHPECEDVFRRHGIEFCCRADLSIADACARSGVDAAVLLAELSRAISAGDLGSTGPDPRLLSTAALVDHIVVQHHEPVRRALPSLRQLAAEVSRAHGDDEPALRELEAAVTELAATLVEHLDEEEAVLFPSLVSHQSGAPSLASSRDEHRAIGRLLARVRALASDFCAPASACGSQRRLFAELEALERAVHDQVHLETHVLLPRSRAAW